MDTGTSGFSRFACLIVAALAAGVAFAHATPTETQAIALPCHCPAEQYVANLRPLLEKQVVPALRGGIVAIAASRPKSLAVELTDDPSPYQVGARLDADGSLKVRLSLGYMTMHDAALDAVMVSAKLQRSSALRPYLIYQLLTARENNGHRIRGESTQHAMTFGEFAGIEADEIRDTYAQREWRASRDRLEVESLGWTVAYLLIRADPKLGGSLSFQTSPDGAAAARLAAASSLFPVPPFATAFQLVDVMRSPEHGWDERVLLCRTALLMESGAEAFKVDPGWQARLQEDKPLQDRLASIRSDIAAMRRDARCTSRYLKKGRGVA